MFGNILLLLLLLVVCFLAGDSLFFVVMDRGMGGNRSHSSRASNIKSSRSCCTCNVNRSCGCCCCCLRLKLLVLLLRAAKDGRHGKERVLILANLSMAVLC